MKRILCLFLSVLMVLCLSACKSQENGAASSSQSSGSSAVSSSTAAITRKPLPQYPNGELPKSLKILAIGNSYSDDATKYLWDICKAAGIEEVVIANMYISGCSLDTHWENISGDIRAYTYYKNTDGEWNSKNRVKISTALSEQEWDIVTIQQASWSSGMESSYKHFDKIVKYIYENEPTANVMWHQTWAKCEGSVPAEYGSEQLKMYEAIVKTMQDKVETSQYISGIIPVGTAIQNMRSSYLGDTLHRDDVTHLSKDYGRYTAAMTWFATITGCAIDDIDWVPEAEKEKITDLPLVREAVTNAIKEPYKVTDSKYK
ncbi:MAG: DUF4886 domain-containing protein [Ruminococcaceae bacterium]|nr:DUF4886 domain-containing protein [Oscillospiraceae bacterium]